MVLGCYQGPAFEKCSKLFCNYQRFGLLLQKMVANNNTIYFVYLWISDASMVYVFLCGAILITDKYYIKMFMFGNKALNIVIKLVIVLI